MLQVGETRKGIEIGRKGTNLFVWRGCELCGKERWVRLAKVGKQKRCVSCSSIGRYPNEATRERMKLACKIRWENHPKGGRVKASGGYIKIKLGLGDFFRSMGDCRGYVMEHRLIIARHLNRCLVPWEVVHHRNGIKDDNRLENLELIKGKGRHNTHIERELKGQARQIEALEQRVILLEAENILLRQSSSEITIIHKDKE